MRGTYESKPVHSERKKTANGDIFKQMGVSKRLKVSSLNSQLICVLCSGYYVEATAIVECLHTFCRSCIVKYLQGNNFCPICDVQIDNAKPWSSLRSDKTLQDLVYKLVPGLYQDEMKRRRLFYCRLGGDAVVAEGEEGGFLPHGARFFSQDDSISLSLEYYSGHAEGEEPEPAKGRPPAERPKRYLQCPAAVTVRHLKKFLRMKYGIGVDCWVDIIYNDECLPENFSLIDVAYTFAWKRTSPMRFAYRIFSKATFRILKPQRNLAKAQAEEGAGKRAKEPTLEQQMQSEYLENFNLNPTNSGFHRTQSCSRTKGGSRGGAKGRKEERWPSSEDSSASGGRTGSEREGSWNGQSEDSGGGGERGRKGSFGEEAGEGLGGKKAVKSKEKWEERKRRGKEGRGERRRRSAGHAGEGEEEERRKSGPKRRKTIAEEVGVKGELGNEEEDPKSEALRKVFVTKEKPEEGFKKKRKKSKHHEGEAKKRKAEVIPTAPSIMSIGKDALKLKVKLTPSKPLVVSVSEESGKREEEGKGEGEEKGEAKEEEKKVLTDKERLLHLRAVRHKSTTLKPAAKEYNTPPSLTISKVDSSEHLSLKCPVVESKPSLEIMLVSSNNNNQQSNPGKNGTKTNSAAKKRDVTIEPVLKPDPNKTPPRPPNPIDTFGVLDLSEKSTRTKENGPTSSPPKDPPDPPERPRKTPHQTIMQIAQNLVNRKLSPPKPPLKPPPDADSSAAMRNLKTLSDTAVNILMAQNKPFAPDALPRPFPPLALPPPTPPPDCENAAGIKIPVYPPARDRIPPVPSLHEIYPRPRGRALPAIKPGQNQTVRQIPNPFMVLSRQTGHHAPNPPSPQQPAPEAEKPEPPKAKPPPPEPDPDAKAPRPLNNNSKPVQNGADGGKHGEDRKGVVRMNCGSTTARKMEGMAKNIESVAAGLTARAVSNAMINAK